MIRFVATCLLIFCAGLSLPAKADIGVPTDQTKKFQIPLSEGLKQGAGLFDKSRLSLNHTIGITYGSGRLGGLNQYYLSDFSYQVSAPIAIKAQIGFQNNLTGTPLYGSANGGRTQVVIPYVGILYQPKPNLRIEIGFSNMPSGQSLFGNQMP